MFVLEALARVQSNRNSENSFFKSRPTFSPTSRNRLQGVRTPPVNGQRLPNS